MFVALRLLDASSTVLQWGPVADNPAFPGGTTLIGLVIAGVGGLTTLLGIRWLRGADRDRDYPTPDEAGTRRLSPAATTTVGFVLLAAGLILAFGG